MFLTIFFLESPHHRRWDWAKRSWPVRPPRRVSSAAIQTTRISKIKINTRKSPVQTSKSWKCSILCSLTTIFCDHNHNAYQSLSCYPTQTPRNMLIFFDIVIWSCYKISPELRQTVLTFTIFSDPDSEAPDLSNISPPDHFDVLTAIIEHLDISSDSLEEENWENITQSAINSHNAQVSTHFPLSG